VETKIKYGYMHAQTGPPIRTESTRVPTDGRVPRLIFIPS
jgi:hypothetical protein